MSLLYFYAMCAVMFVDICLLIGSVLHKDKKAVKSFIIIICLIITAQLCYSASLLLNGIKIKFWIHELKFIGVAYFSTAFFKMYMDYFEKPRMASRKNILLLMIVPTISVIWALTNSYHHLFRTRLYILNNRYGSFVGVESGILFWVYILYSYTIYLIGIILFIRYFLKTPRIYRMQSGIMIFAAVATMFINFVSISGIFFEDFGDATLISFTIAAAIQFYGLVVYRPVHMIQIARSMAVNEMKSPIIIFDYEDMLLEANLAARKVFPEINGNLNSFLEHNFKATDTAVFENADAYYTVSKKKIIDRQGAFSGTMILMNDMTEMKRRERDLKKLANHDYLTGIPNHQAFQQELTKIRNEDLPVAVIHFNISGMKSINAAHGNEQGDIIIKKVASVITEAASHQGFCARLEGDKFVLILKNTQEAAAKQVIEKINSQLQGITLIHGLAMKKGVMDNIQLIVKVSMDNLYKNKILNKLDRV